MPTFETPDLPEPKAVPYYLMGAASPLWAYFATAAAGGVAFWWMTRWARPTNLEAMFEEPAVESSTSSLFESATINAVAEPEPEPEAVIEAAPEPEPVIEAAPEPVAELAPAPRPRAKKPAPNLADEA